MRIAFHKIRLFFKSVENAILGISAEVIFTIFFILIGFSICLVWWVVFK